jgi:hypothetical protein
VGVLILLVYLHLARRSIAALAPWLGVAISVVAISIDHGSMASVAIIMLVVSIVTMAAAAIPAVAWHRGR